MIRRHVPLAVAAILVLLAAGLGVLAVQAWRWPEQAAVEDGRLAREDVPAETWDDGGTGLTTMLLGVRDDAAFRRAVTHFRRGRPDYAGADRTTEQIVSSIEAGIELAAIAPGGGPPARRSSALNLRAILRGELAVFEPRSGARLAAAADLLRRAIRLDPTNDAAKANLELLYRLAGDRVAAAEETGGFGGYGEDAGSAVGGSGY